MSMGMSGFSQSAEQYAANNNFSKNQTRIAGLLDGYAPAQSVLLSLDTREQLENVIQPLLVAEAAAGAVSLPMFNPNIRIFNRLSNLPTNNFRNVNSVGEIFRGQTSYSSAGCQTGGKREFWFEGFYRAEKIDGDSNALGYKTSRGGMMIGVDKAINNWLTTGLVLGYGNPRAYNSVGRIEADDFTFGVYSRLKISAYHGIYANAFLGFGNQSYNLKNSNNIEYSGDGDSFYASLEFFKPINFRNGVTFSPLVAVDFQQSWSDGFNLNISGIPLSISNSDMKQTVLRAGINSTYKNFRSKLQYGYLVGGDLYGLSRASITDGTNSRVITGVNLGRHNLNIGFGGDFKISKTAKLFADYDLDLGENSTAHTGQVGLMIAF
jgi:outer membrane autotransporter protein